MKQGKALGTSIRFFYTYRFLMHFILVFPVYPLLFQARGMSLMQISLLLIIWSLSAIVLEVPSGVLSDRWNRVSLLVISALLRAGGYLLWIFAADFWTFGGGFILWGAGESFSSGTEEAWLFDTLKVHGKEERYDRIAGKGYFLAGTGVALSTALGGFVASFSVTLTLVCSVAACILGMLAVLPLTDVRHITPVAPEKGGSFIQTLRQGAGECRRNPDLLSGILFISLILCTAEFLDEYDPLFARWYGMQYSLIGIWVSLRYLLSSLSGAGAWMIRKVYASPFGRYLLSAAGGGCLLLPVLFRQYALLPLYLLFYMIFTALRVQTEARLQGSVKGDSRATVLSISSLGENVAAIIFSFIFGVISDLHGLSAGFIVFAVYLVVFSPGFLLLRSPGRGRQNYPDRTAEHDEENSATDRSDEKKNA